MIWVKWEGQAFPYFYSSFNTGWISFHIWLIRPSANSNSLAISLLEQRLAFMTAMLYSFVFNRPQSNNSFA